MSHQSGIVASDALRKRLAECKDGSVRLLKVSIVEEKLELDQSIPHQGSWEEDYDALILPLLEEKQPCYLLYRLDSKNNMGNEWIFIAYSPDFSPVRQKMLYASTRATLKMEFGSGQIKEELFGTVRDDVTLAAYKKHLQSQHAPPPLTMAEEELNDVKRSEVKTEISVTSKQQTVSGVSFPVVDSAWEKLEDLRNGAINYVQLRIDLEQERIVLEEYDTIDVHQLPKKVPSDSARYHFYVFKHSHEGDYLESIVFIYSIAGYKSPIKERMLYSSCKEPLVGNVERTLGVEIAKKIEIDDGGELTEAFVYDEVHPKTTIVRQQFAKPKGPGGRGPRRITKH